MKQKLKYLINKTPFIWLSFIALFFSIVTTPFINEILADKELNKTLIIGFNQTVLFDLYAYFNSFITVKFGMFLYLVNFFLALYSLLFFYVVWYSKKEQQMSIENDKNKSLFYIIGFTKFFLVYFVFISILNQKMLLNFELIYNYSMNLIYSYSEEITHFLGIGFLLILIVYIGLIPLIIVWFKIKNFQFELLNPIDTFPEMLLAFNHSIMSLGFMFFIFFLYTLYEKKIDDLNFKYDIKKYIYIAFIYSFLLSLFSNLRIPLYLDNEFILMIITILPFIFLIKKGDLLENKYSHYKPLKNSQSNNINSLLYVKLKRKKMFALSILLAVPSVLYLFVNILLYKNDINILVVLITVLFLFFLYLVNLLMIKTKYSLKDKT